MPLRISKQVRAQPYEAFPKDGPLISRWKELGYRVVRPCAGAQIQV